MRQIHGVIQDHLSHSTTIHGKLFSKSIGQTLEMTDYVIHRDNSLLFFYSMDCYTYQQRIKLDQFFYFFRRYETKNEAIH